MGYLKGALAVHFNFLLQDFSLKFGIVEVLQMHPIASHLVVNRNLKVKIGQVFFSSVSRRSWCLESITLKGASLRLLGYKDCELSSKEVDVVGV